MIRTKFPALRNPAIFFDNPGGTHVVHPVLDRMTAYLFEHNAGPKCDKTVQIIASIFLLIWHADFSQLMLYSKYIFNIKHIMT